MSMDVVTETGLSRLLSDETRFMLLLDGALGRDLEKRLNGIDPFTHRYWLYETTEYESEKEQGPLLVQCTEGSALTDAFTRDFVREHLGLLLFSQQPVEKIIDHLRTLRHALMPNGHRVRFRLQEPRKLRGIADGIPDDEHDHLLGPLERILWCEWHGDRGDWYTLYQDRAAVRQPATGPLMFSDTMLRTIDAQDFDYAVCCMARRIVALGLSALRFSSDEKVLEETRELARNARAGGADSDDVLEAEITQAFCNRPGVLIDPRTMG